MSTRSALYLMGCKSVVPTKVITKNSEGNFMNHINKPLIVVHFLEHPYSVPGKKPPSEHDIILTAEFTMSNYCQALFNKILKIGLSEIHTFLKHQCKLVADSLNWINTLEKLIKDNKGHFHNDDLLFRRHKFISQLDVQRLRLESSDILTTRTNTLHEMINGFTDKREYIFAKVLDHCKNMATSVEKIDYLQDQIFEYRQNYPKYISTSGKPYDELCQLEIDRLNKKEELHEKNARKNSNDNGLVVLSEKICINSNLNYVADFFFQLLNELKVDGKPVISATNTQIAQLLSNNFVDKNGKPITVRSIQRIC